jgi:hypothetical protein
MARIELEFDVTDALPSEATQGARIVISGWLYLPPAGALPSVAPRAMVLLAGGSYDKRYHDAQIPGHGGYSAAEHLAAQGNIVLLNDHLGIGGSSRLPDQKQATRHVCALAAHAACQQFFQRLAEGTLDPSLPPVPDAIRIGGGHSMGGMQTILQQADHRSFDAIMVLGYTAEGVHMVMGGRKFPAASVIPQESPDYTQNDRSAMHEAFHWSDVPAEVIAYDDSLSVETPAGIGLDSIRTRIVADEAARIAEPIYICLGENDVSPDYHAEPSYYRSSPDVTLHILSRSGHCQTFASSRHEMWDRMTHWGAWIAQRKGAA